MNLTLLQWCNAVTHSGCTVAIHISITSHFSGLMSADYKAEISFFFLFFKGFQNLIFNAIFSFITKYVFRWVPTSPVLVHIFLEIASAILRTFVNFLVLVPKIYTLQSISIGRMKTYWGIGFVHLLSVPVYCIHPHKFCHKFTSWFTTL